MLLRLFADLLAFIPLPILHILGAMFGSLFALFPNRHRRITLRNLALCFPELPERERARLLVLNLRETAKTVLETAKIWRSGRRRLQRLIRETQGEKYLHDALAKGQGVIFAVPHLGSWELVGQYLAMLGPIASMYKPAKNEALDRIMLEGRSRLGMQMAPTDASGVRILLAALKKGGSVGILPDQDPREGGGVFAPFFGIATNTMTLLPKLATRSGSPVLVVYAERLPWGRGFRIHHLPVDPAVNSRDEAASAAALNKVIETAVRQCPTQYAWSYKRFRTRPEGETSLYL